MTQDQEMFDLKPCPFCGGSVKLEKTLRGNSWGVVCRSGMNLGGTCAIEQIPSATEFAAAKRWNTRAIEADLIQALMPFAECVGQISEDESDEEWAKFRLLVSHYRKARAAIAKATGGAQ